MLATHQNERIVDDILIRRCTRSSSPSSRKRPQHLFRLYTTSQQCWRIQQTDMVCGVLCTILRRWYISGGWTVSKDIVPCGWLCKRHAQQPAWSLRSILDLHNSHFCALCLLVTCWIGGSIHQQWGIRLWFSTLELRACRRISVFVLVPSNRLGCDQVLWMPTEYFRNRRLLWLCNDDMGACLGMQILQWCCWPEKYSNHFCYQINKLLCIIPIDIARWVFVGIAFGLTGEEN